mgnify:CR=1 FL=1
MKRGRGRRPDERERAEDRRRRSVEVRQSNGRRRDQRLLGATRTAALAARRERQIAAAPQVRRVQPTHDKQVREQPGEQHHGHDAAMPQRAAKN